MVILLQSGRTLSNVTKIEEGDNGYAWVTRDGREEPLKQPLEAIVSIHEEL